MFKGLYNGIVWLIYRMYLGPKPRVVVFASGTKDGGGSGFEELVRQSRTNPHAWFEVVAVVSNHGAGGVYRRAHALGIPFCLMMKPFTAENYKEVVAICGAEWVALSGWLKKVHGLPPERVFNIHPGPTRTPFGGKGMYGHRVHEAVCAAWHLGEIPYTEMTMHFVTTHQEGEYDDGAVFMRLRVPLEHDDTPDSIQQRVNQFEHREQWWGTYLVVNRFIRLDKNGEVVVPEWYMAYQHCPQELKTPIRIITPELLEP